MAWHWVLAGLALLLAGALTAATAPGKTGAFTKGRTAYAVGEAVRLVGPRERAELEALRVAVDQLAKLLERKGYGDQRELAQGVENALTKESDLTRWKLGRVRIDSVMQERWEAPDGKDAWNVKVKISVALR
jgi:hypothetical protein